MPVLQQALAEAGIADQVEVIASTCRDRCDYGPSMNIYPGPTFYNQINEEAIVEIVREHLAAGRPVSRWFFRPSLVSAGKARSPF